MDLSDLILKKHEQEALNYILSGAKLDYIDHYGTTPLINAVLMNHIPLIKALLKQGAQVDFADYGGHTPLFWACDNNLLEVSECLLKAGANPNAFDFNGQPILVFPFLRQQESLKKQLIDYGANLQFAQDYVHTKLIGHRFELKGETIISAPKKVFVEMDYEGFIPEFSITVIQQSLQNLLTHYSGRSLKAYFPYVKNIISALEVAHELRRLRHHAIQLEQEQATIKTLLQKNDFLIIPVTFEGHAITFVRLGPFWAHCDRGERSQTHHAITLYQSLMPTRITLDFLKELLYKPHTAHEINQQVQQYLQLTPIGAIPTTSQISGNCSWANVEASIPTLMFMLMQAESPSLNYETTQQAAMAFYEAWREWDKDLALDLCIEHFKSGDELRKTSKAHVMADILFYRCKVENPIEVTRAKKIISILVKYQMKSLLTVYVDQAVQDLSYPLAANFIQLLQMAGLDYRLLQTYR